MLVNPGPTTSCSTDNAMSSTGHSIRIRAQGPHRCQLRLYLPLGNGDSIASSHQYASLPPCTKKCPFHGEECDPDPKLYKSHTKSFKSYSECLALGLKCQGYVESKDPGRSKDSVLKLRIMLEVGKMENLC